MSDPRTVDPAAQNGDLSRERVAELLMSSRVELAAILRRRIRGKTALALDLDDVMSSAFRRIDLMCVRGLLRAKSEQELRALALVVAKNLASARARSPASQVVVAAESLDRTAGKTLEPDRSEARGTVARIAESIARAASLDLFLLKARGLTDSQAAAASCRTRSSTRKRWLRLRRELRVRFS